MERREQLKELLPGLRNDLREARARMDLATTEYEALAKMISGMEGYVSGQGQASLPIDFPAALPHRNGAGTESVADEPRGKEAVRRILQESGQPMKAQAIIREILAREWIDPNAKNPGAAIRVAIRRLAEDRVVEKVSTGIYKYAQPAEEVGGAKTEA